MVEDAPEKFAPMVRCRHLGNVDRYDSRDGSSPEPRDDSRDEDEVGGLRRCLQRAADEGEQGREEHTVDATNLVSKPAAKEGANDSA